ncbi:uncharacterized protein LOC143257688 [Tachypleus tridentatus]|uniref:uncharacterized protein LOC143257688 n=1 Tax=Tachypleus tridentatus TaxID=6853 RepID=UPI003FD479EC
MKTYVGTTVLIVIIFAIVQLAQSIGFYGSQSSGKHSIGFHADSQYDGGKKFGVLPLPIALAGYGQGLAGYGQGYAGYGQGYAGYGQGLAGYGQGYAGYGSPSHYPNVGTYSPHKPSGYINDHNSGYKVEHKVLHQVSQDKWH